VSAQSDSGFADDKDYHVGVPLVSKLRKDQTTSVLRLGCDKPEEKQHHVGA